LRGDVISDHVDIVNLSQSLAQRLDKGCFTRPDWATNANAQGAVIMRPRVDRSIQFDQSGHDRNNLVYCVSWAIEARSTITPAEPRSSVVSLIASSPARSAASSSAAMASCPSVCPRGISRTTAVTKLAVEICRNESKEKNIWGFCPSDRIPRTTAMAGCTRRSRSVSESQTNSGSDHTWLSIVRQAVPCCDDSSTNSAVLRKAAASSAISSNLARSSSAVHCHALLKKMA